MADVSLRRSLISSALAVATLLAACGSGGDPAPEPIRGWPVTAVRVDDQVLRVVLAVDPAQGLRGIEDLGDLDGMLFDYGSDVDPAAHRFWMKDVLIPLDIAWFDADGRLVGTASMSICELDCPTWEAPAPFRWAVESPAGSIVLSDGATLDAPG